MIDLHFTVALNEATAARRRFPVYLVDDTDGKTAETGVTFSTGDIKVSKNGAAEGNHGGTVSELAGGMYYYEASSGEVDTEGFLSFRFTKSGVRTFVAIIQVRPDVLCGDLNVVEARAAKRSLATAAMKAVHRTKNNAGSLEIYRSDGSTVHATQALTADASQVPLVEEAGVV